MHHSYSSIHLKEEKKKKQLNPVFPEIIYDYNVLLITFYSLI